MAAYHLTSKQSSKDMRLCVLASRSTSNKVVAKFGYVSSRHRPAGVGYQAFRMFPLNAYKHCIDSMRRTAWTIEHNNSTLFNKGSQGFLMSLALRKRRSHLGASRVPGRLWPCQSQQQFLQGLRQVALQISDTYASHFCSGQCKV